MLEYVKNCFKQVLLVIRGGFVKNVFLLSGGVVIAQASSFLLTPIVARLYSPHDFGLMALFSAITLPLTNISSLKYEQAILIVEEKSAIKVSSFCILISIFFCFISLVVIFVIRQIHPVFLAQLGNWVYFVPVFILVASYVKMSNFFCIQREKYKSVSGANIVGGLATPVGRIFYASLFSANLTGLILSQFFSNMTKAILLTNLQSVKMWMKTNLVGLLETARKYSDFPKYNLPSGLLFSLGNQAPVLMLGFLFDPHIVGFYSLATRVMGLPVNLISQPIRQVFMQKISERVRAGKSIMNFIIILSLTLMIFMLPFFFLVEIYGGSIFSCFLGSRWVEAGKVAGIIFPWIFMNFIINPVASLYIILRKQKYWFRFQVILNCLLLILFVSSQFIKLSSTSLLWSISGVNVCVYACVFIHIIMLGKGYEKTVTVIK